MVPDDDDEEESESTSGWLLKWTNYAKGYRRRWFVVSRGNLSYFRKITEEIHAQRGSINLENAIIHSYDSSSFAITKSDNDNTFYLKAADTDERQNWIRALEKAKLWAINHKERLTTLPWDANFNEKEKQIFTTISEVGSKLLNIHECNRVQDKHGLNLKNQLITLQKTKSVDDIPKKIQDLLEEADLFKTATSAMIKACTTFIEEALMKYSNAFMLLHDEAEERHELEKLVEEFEKLQLMLQTTITNKDISKISADYLKNTNTNDFESTTSRSIQRTQKSISSFQLDVLNDSNTNLHTKNRQVPDDLLGSLSVMISPANLRNTGIKRVRRTRIPDKPNLPISLWSIMKTSIGKDLSKIPMPVNFSEPISFLQRAAEDFAYSDVLDKAATCSDDYEQIAYLGAFIISSYSTTVHRTAKPFNPLLGETYEWDRTDDLGWRLISEQVSHHPPIAAQYCESKEWTCWQEFAMSSKFRGKYLMIIPHGLSHIKFHKSGNHYTWTKVNTIVNNIVIGKLWVENTGETDIIQKKTGSKCHLNFIPYSMFKGDDQRKVIGEVTDKSGEVKWLINGKWDTEVLIARVKKKSGKPDNPIYEMETSISAWRAKELPEDSHKYYYFNEFACQLNEPEEGIAPTDSRNRPDQRLMENGHWDEANIIKTSLEEKQREARKLRSVSGVYEEAPSKSNPDIDTLESHSYEPTWFKTEIDPSDGRVTYIYTGGYWEAKAKQDWDRCPNIF